MTASGETEMMTADAALRQAVGAADRTLAPAGFVRSGRGRVWRRETPELLHVIELDNGDVHGVQWSTVCPEALPVLYAERIDPASVAAGMITGRPNNIDVRARGATFSFGRRVTPERAAKVADRLAEALMFVVAALAGLDTRADLRELLIASGPAPEERFFFLPSSRSMQLFAAAILAVLDGTADAQSLMDGATAAGMAADDDRLQRLRDLAAQAG